MPRARDARGRFAKGTSDNPRGRPRGIPNPRRRALSPGGDPGIAALGARALSNLLDRKPRLLRPLAKQLLPPPLAPIDPAERLGIDLSSLRMVEDCLQVLAAILTAALRGNVTPAEGLALPSGWMPGCARTGALHDWVPAAARIGCVRPLAYSAAPRRCEKPCSWLVMNSSSAARPSQRSALRRSMREALLFGAAARPDRRRLGFALQCDRFGFRLRLQQRL